MTIPTPENTGHFPQMTSPVATAAGLFDHSTSAAMGEMLNDVGLSTVPMRPDLASTIGNLPVTILSPENTGNLLQMTSSSAMTAELVDRTIGDLPVPSVYSGLFSKLPPDSYNNATALASARVGALSTLLKSKPEASDVVQQDQFSTAPVNFPYDLPPPTPPSMPRTTRQQMLRDEMSESLRHNLLWQRKLSRMDTIGPQPRRTNGPVNVPGARQQVENSLVRVMLRVPGAPRDAPADETVRARRRADEEELVRNLNWADTSDYHLRGW
ncbi:hypothetical protein B0H19DRAFT_1197610 [Mycena capillaripes]|nr:hypothetical protein B0H19DRAFT_1197610 [Mycena capillaripes]